MTTLFGERESGDICFCPNSSTYCSDNNHYYQGNSFSEIFHQVPLLLQPDFSEMFHKVPLPLQPVGLGMGLPQSPLHSIPMRITRRAPSQTDI